jgi:ribA/ribD-fused uncharacterized protein
MLKITSPFTDKYYKPKYTVDNLSEDIIDCIFFWQTDKSRFLSKGCFSQWQTSIFVVEGTRYFCAEQYMMGQKAIAFNDPETFEKILSANHPKKIKSLGREVKNFDSNEWDKIKYAIVLNGNFYKFSQNEELLKVLISTGNKILVEASPFDNTWGIGLSEESELIGNSNCWKGQNLLGFALMEVRDEIKRMLAEGSK